MSETLSDNRKMKELRVLELHQQGYSYRKIASLVHLSLRDVTKYIHRISNKTKSASTTSIMDEVILEYRVTGLRREVKDLQIEREKLNRELADLHALKIKVQNELYVKRVELDSMMRKLENEKFFKRNNERYLY
jgi:predicted  nucleic acid-binding Zn-ribbon protein